VSVFYIAGPTASGKSALAVALAERFNGEIVNADAFQVYRGLEILTASPTAEECSRVAHHLLGIIGPEEEFQAARFATLAREAIAGVVSRGHTALVAGGSGLYLKALTHGLDDLPSDAGLRSSLQRLSLDEKIARLRSLDPEGATGMNLANPRHIERALEICLLTGRPASGLKRRWEHADETALWGVLLVWPREVLHRRIKERVKEMFTRGAIDEVARVDQSGGFSTTAGRAIGVGEIRRFLAGSLTRQAAIELTVQATRRYAKRQMTWFRSERWLKTICLDRTDTPESVVDRVTGELEACVQSTSP
jgi:tRNA dimethylallyltransferase